MIDLMALPFDKDDDIREIYRKYYDEVPQIQGVCPLGELAGSRQRFFAMLDREEGVGPFGQHINAISHLHGQMFVSQALRRLQKLQREVFDYEFKEPMLLLEAMTHKTGKSHFNLPFNYEKLEILGDAILDYLANSNLLRFTLFERYLKSNPDEYKFGEDFLCGDAHQAKKQLVTNEVIAKLCVFLGLHKYIVYYDTQEDSYSHRDVEDYLNFSFISTNFKMNESEIEHFEAPKILGDILESVIGAIFVDGGLKAVMHVMKHIISPLLLFVAKFSKEVCKEPKEQFVIKAQTDFRIKPKFFIHENVEVMEVASKQVIEAGQNQFGQPVYHRLMAKAAMYHCDILYRKGQVLCSGFGNTKH